MLSQSKYTGAQFHAMSDSRIDSVYAVAFDSKDAFTASGAGVEILDRLATARSFITGALGIVRFPLYDARGAFQQVDTARDAIADNTKKVVDSLSTGMYGLIALIVFVGVVVLVVKLKK